MSLLQDLLGIQQRLFGQPSGDPPRARVVLLREELVAITGDDTIAIILSQLIFRHKYYGLAWLPGGAGKLKKDCLLTCTPRTIQRKLRKAVELGLLEDRQPGEHDRERDILYRVKIDVVIERVLAAGFQLPEEPAAAQENEQEASNPGSAHATQCPMDATQCLDGTTESPMDATQCPMIKEQKSFDKKQQEQELVVPSAKSIEDFDPELARASLAQTPVLPPVLQPPQGPAAAVMRSLDETVAAQLLKDAGVAEHGIRPLMLHPTVLQQPDPLAYLRRHVEALPYYTDKAEPVGYMIRAIQRNYNLPKQMRQAEAAARRESEKQSLEQQILSFVEQAKAGSNLILASGKRLVIQGIRAIADVWTLDVMDEKGDKAFVPVGQALQKGALLA